MSFDSTKTMEKLKTISPIRYGWGISYVGAFCNVLPIEWRIG